MSRGGTEARSKGIQAVVITGRIGYGEDEDGGLGGGTERGGGGDEFDGDKDRKIHWEDNEANSTLETEHNYPLAYALGMKYHHLIMKTLGNTRVQLDKKR